MTTLTPIDPNERIEILDGLRGFAILGIIFNNMLYFSGYVFVPFFRVVFCFTRPLVGLMCRIVPEKIRSNQLGDYMHYYLMKQ